jgi:hypothetical protein
MAPELGRFAFDGGLMKHARVWWIALGLLVSCPLGLNAQGPTGRLVAQAGQPGQQQPPQYTKEQIEELKKQNQRARNQNALIKQANEAMTAKNWHCRRCSAAAADRR